MRSRCRSRSSPPSLSSKPRRRHHLRRRHRSRQSAVSLIVPSRCDVPSESRLSAIETVIVAFTAVTTFVLGFGYWKITTRQNEQEEKLALRARDSEAALARVERTVDELNEL